MLGLAAVVAYTGSAPVSARGSGGEGVDWFLETARDHAVESAAEELREDGAIPDLDDARLIARGAHHYGESCVTCHGGPGVKSAEFARGMEPQPPHLTFGTHRPAETYWIVKNGIRMTGMPSFARGHSEEDLWGITAFVRKLPDMSKEEYERLTAEDGSDHHHDGGGSD
jgi:mono/diheme cytochrome c family protein